MHLLHLGKGVRDSPCCDVCCHGDAQRASRVGRGRERRNENKHGGKEQDSRNGLVIVVAALGREARAGGGESNLGGREVAFGEGALKEGT